MAMTVWVLMLRGVNVGGAGRLPMADLRALLTRLGCEAVETYIQSGNAVFRFAGDAAVLAEADCARALPKRFGFRPAVFLREAERWRRCWRPTPLPRVSMIRSR